MLSCDDRIFRDNGTNKNYLNERHLFKATFYYILFILWGLSAFNGFSYKRILPSCKIQREKDVNLMFYTRLKQGVLGALYICFLFYCALWASYSPHIPVYDETEGGEPILLVPAHPEDVDMIVVFSIPVIMGIVFFFWASKTFQGRMRIYALTIHCTLALAVVVWRSMTFWGI